MNADELATTPDTPSVPPAPPAPGAPSRDPGATASPASPPVREGASRTEPVRDTGARADVARDAPGAAPRLDAPSRGGRGWRAMSVAALVIALVAAFCAAALWQRSERVSREAARRLQEADIRIAQLDQLVKQSQDQVRDMLGRSAVLENRLNETQGQQAQLERMYRSIAQDTLDAVLADVENSVSIASQQLLVGGNVQGALVALQDADGRLKRSDEPIALGLRRLVTRDIERLKAVPQVDITSLTVRLDSVASMIDQLPLVASLAPAPAAPAPARSTESADASSGTIGRIADSGRRGWQAFKDEMMALFRVSKLDAPDAVLLAPDQQYFVRENLRLALLSARLALVARNDTVYHNDLERAIGWLNTYYDRDQRPVQAALASLRQLQSNRVSFELPALAETLSAIRAARAPREPKS